MITSAQAAQAQVILAGMQLPPNLGESTQLSQISRFGKRAWLRAHSLLTRWRHRLPELNLPDGIHPNAQGHQHIAGQLDQLLRPLLNPEAQTTQAAQPWCPINECRQVLR